LGGDYILLEKVKKFEPMQITVDEAWEFIKKTFLSKRKLYQRDVILYIQ
jgi:hypothetical protein